MGMQKSPKPPNPSQTAPKGDRASVLFSIEKLMGGPLDHIPESFPSMPPCYVPDETSLRRIYREMKKRNVFSAKVRISAEDGELHGSVKGHVSDWSFSFSSNIVSNLIDRRSVKKKAFSDLVEMLEELGFSTELEKEGIRSVLAVSRGAQRIEISFDLFPIRDIRISIEGKVENAKNLMDMANAFFDVYNVQVAIESKYSKSAEETGIQRSRCSVHFSLYDSTTYEEAGEQTVKNFRHLMENRDEILAEASARAKEIIEAGAEYRQPSQIGEREEEGFRVEQSTARIDDIGGYVKVKEQLRMIQDEIGNSEWYAKHGCDPVTGVLLNGPPGTGKTLAGLALAGELDCPFMLIGGGDIFNVWFGQSEQKVIELFDFAEKLSVERNGPVVLFLDEVDQFAASDLDRIRKSVLTEFKRQLGTLTVRKGRIIVFMTTNAEQNDLDPAMIRAGRINRIIFMGKPSEEEREEIISIHLRKKEDKARENGREMPLFTLAPEDVRSFAKATEGMVGADIEDILNKACILVAHTADRDSEANVNMDHIKAVLLERSSERTTRGRIGF